MAAPTEAEIQTQINHRVWLLHQAHLFLGTSTENVAGIYDDAVAVLEGDFAALSLAGLDGLRARASSLVSVASGRAMLDPLFREYGKLNSFPETDPVAILDRLLVKFAEDGGRVTTRAFTFGTPANGGGNTGDGTLNRLTVDRYGYALEAATTEVKTLRCVSDRHSGSGVHQETFEIRGAEIPRDFAAGVVSADRTGAISALSADDSQTFVSNPSFSAYTGDAPDITTINNWTVTTAIGNFQIELTDVYRTAVHEASAPGSVRFEADDKLTQAFTVASPTLNPLVPYYCQIAFKRESSCDGTLTLRVGANSVQVTLAAQSGWTILRLVLDENLFLRLFNATTLDVEIELASRTTGALLVDDIVFAPMTRFDGTWWALVGGATPYLVDDTITATDTATESILQKWLWRMYGRHLPHATGGSVTWAEPS